MQGAAPRRGSTGSRPTEPPSPAAPAPPDPGPRSAAEPREPAGSRPHLLGFLPPLAATVAPLPAVALLGCLLVHPSSAAQPAPSRAVPSPRPPSPCRGWCRRGPGRGRAERRCRGGAGSGGAGRPGGAATPGANPPGGAGGARRGPAQLLPSKPLQGAGTAPSGGGGSEPGPAPPRPCPRMGQAPPPRAKRAPEGGSLAEKRNAVHRLTCQKE